MERTAEIEELIRTHQLLEITKNNTPSASRRATRWLSVALFGGAVVVVAVLMTGQVSSIEIELDVVTTDVSFVAGGERVITVPLPARELTVRGVRRVESPTVELDPKTVVNGVMTAIAAEPESRIELASIAPADTDTRFAMATTDVPHQLRLGLAMPPSTAGTVEVVAWGSVRLGAAAEPVRFAGQSVSAIGEPGRELVLEVMLPEGQRGNLVSPGLRVRGVELDRIHDESTTGHRLLVRRSGIIEGTLRLLAIGNKAITLAEGEVVSLGCVSGELRRITAGAEEMRVRFHGSVCALQIGYDTYRTNLMPTWLEWLRAREPLTALWIAVGWLFGVAASLLAWWRKPS